MLSGAVEIQKLLDMYEPQELLPELAPYVQESLNFPGMMILHHPLIIIPMFSPQQNKLANQSYIARTEHLARLVEQRDYMGQLLRHERPYRFDALTRLRDEIEDPAEYWGCVRRTWTDSENISENLPAWIELWSDPCPFRHAVMDEAERQQLDRLPDTLTIYRGYSRAEHRNGLSWTLSRKQAVWFARRWDEAPRLLTGTVMKRDVLAHFRGRDEDEIVAFPETIMDKRSRRV